ncbi:MAG: SRPBCC family protein [Verrucomicrobiales bacterium]|nr:SRPBCC family protein [Verrucomicrobiales bacterium]
MPEIHLSKSIIVGVSPEVAYASVRDFKQWPVWSPWLITEPGCEVNFSEDGSSYSWEGEVIGSGTLSVMKESAPRLIDLDLVFLKPWKSRAGVKMRFASKDEGTEITWTMKSSLPPFLFWMKNTMIAAIRMDYERGLRMLKDHLETGEVPTQLSFAGESFDAIHFIGITSACSIEDIGESMEADFGKLKSWLTESGSEPTGYPRSVYHKWDIVKGRASYSVGFPMAVSDDPLPEGISAREFPAMKTFAITHTGPYRHLGNAWAAGIMRERGKKIRQRRGVHPFEIYKTMPGGISENETVTVVHFPVKD